MKQISAILIAAALSLTYGNMHAQEIEPESNFSGYAYEGTRVASTISPNVVIGTIAVAAVIAVVVAGNDTHHHHHKSHNHHGHSHSHSH